MDCFVGFAFSQSRLKEAARPYPRGVTSAVQPAMALSTTACSAGQSAPLRAWMVRPFSTVA